MAPRDALGGDRERVLRTLVVEFAKTTTKRERPPRFRRTDATTLAHRSAIVAVPVVLVVAVRVHIAPPPPPSRPVDRAASARLDAAAACCAKATPRRDAAAECNGRPVVSPGRIRHPTVPAHTNAASDRSSTGTRAIVHPGVTHQGHGRAEIDRAAHRQRAEDLYPARTRQSTVLALAVRLDQSDDGVERGAKRRRRRAVERRGVIRGRRGGGGDSRGDEARGELHHQRDVLAERKGVARGTRRDDVRDEFAKRLRRRRFFQSPFRPGIRRRTRTRTRTRIWSRVGGFGVDGPDGVALERRHGRLAECGVEHATPRAARHVHDASEESRSVARA